MWVDDNSLAYFMEQAQRHGAVVLDGLPAAADRFLTASGAPQTRLMVSRTPAGTYAVLVPEDLTPRLVALAPPFSNGLCQQGWRILALPTCHTVAQALGYGGYLLGLQADWPQAPVPPAGEPPAPAQEHAATPPADSPGAVRVPSAEREASLAAPAQALPFTRDLTEAARRGELPPVHGRERETDQVLTILLQREKNCPLLVGEPGVGKTAVVEKLARLSAADRLPPRLRGLRVLALDAAQLLAESGHKGAVEKNVLRVMDGLGTNPQWLLFADEIHALTEAQGDLSVLEIMKPRLARGLRVIGATTHAEFKQKVSSDQALVRRFDLVPVAEPTPGETEAVLRAWLPALADHHGVQVHPDLVGRVVCLADELLSGPSPPGQGSYPARQGHGRRVAEREPGGGWSPVGTEGVRDV